MRSLFAVASRRSSPPAPSVGVIDPVGSSLIAGLPPAREAAVMRSIKFEFVLNLKTAQTRALSAGFLGRASRLSVGRRSRGAVFLRWRSAPITHAIGAKPHTHWPFVERRRDPAQ
jgi:hypothetical protein